MATQNSLESAKAARKRAKEEAKSFINKYAEHETSKRSARLYKGKEYNRINSIIAGREAGNEIVGERYGREGALGAKAAKNKNIKVTDVYTRKNIVARAKQGAVKDVGGGALLGAASGAGAVLATNGSKSTGVDIAVGAGIGAGVGAGVGLVKTGARALVNPAINFYKGKKNAELMDMKRKYSAY